MSKLYYNDCYQKDFTAEILSVVEKEDTFHIVLDQTAFYPEGGGQASDTGFIEDSPITYVYQKNELIYHVSTKKPIKIHKVKCTINWDKRLDYMQHHMAQHILSACLLNTFGVNTLSFHLGNETCTIDIDKTLSSAELLEGEHLANDVIANNIPTEILYPTKQELKKLFLKKPVPKVDSPLRIIKIGDLDSTPCCGLHPHSTIEVQLLKILKWEKYKNMLRITFIAGQRAVKDALRKEHFTQEICYALKGNEKDILEKIQGITQNLNSLANENRNLKNTVADYEVKTMLDEALEIDNVRIIKILYENIDLKNIQLIGNKLTAYPYVIALLGIKNKGNAHLIFMCSKEFKNLSMNTLLKDSITLIDGLGGGNDFSAQGGGKSVSNAESALDYALMKIKAYLSSIK